MGGVTLQRLMAKGVAEPVSFSMAVVGGEIPPSEMAMLAVELEGQGLDDLAYLVEAVQSRQFTSNKDFERIQTTVETLSRQAKLFDPHVSAKLKAKLKERGERSNNPFYNAELGICIDPLLLNEIEGRKFQRAPLNQGDPHVRGGFLLAGAGSGSDVGLGTLFLLTPDNLTPELVDRIFAVQGDKMERAFELWRDAMRNKLEKIDEAPRPEVTVLFLTDLMFVEHVKIWSDGSIDRRSLEEALAEKEMAVELFQDQKGIRTMVTAAKDLRMEGSHVVAFAKDSGFSDQELALLNQTAAEIVEGGFTSRVSMLLEISVLMRNLFLLLLDRPVP